MFKNAFANLQKVGKSLMLPVSVLPIAGILLGVGSANFSWLPAVVSHVMAEAGGSVFANMPLIFAIGVALGFTNNDGVSALAAVVAYGIMVKTMAVVAPLVLHLPADEIAAKHLADTGVLGGIISGAIAAYMFNRFYRIKLPEYLGFFAGKRFVPIISGLAAIFTGVILSFIWPPIGCGAHGKITFPDGRILRTAKTRHPRGYMEGRYLERQHDVEEADKPFEFFMNRFRLLEAAPRAEFSRYTGLEEAAIRPQLDAAIAQGYLQEDEQNWQITEHGKLFLNSLLELFLNE